MSVLLEFEPVDLLLNSQAETCGVDAFALSFIKAERQVRKVFTYLIYQFPCFDSSHIPQLRNTLASRKRVYFEGFIAGFNALYSKRIDELMGPKYARLRSRLDEAIDYRNKIFHGQLTNEGLSREDLVALVSDIRDWCTRLATAALGEFAYDGFGRNSFRKSVEPNLWEKFQVQFVDINSYKEFISKHMER